MRPIKVAITKCAQKSSTSETRKNGLFRRVIKTGGFSFHKDILGRLRCAEAPKERREQFCLQKAAAT
jgi:hypothetical protein